MKREKPFIKMIVCSKSARSNTMLKKLKSNSGESIAETLVAVLISAFALLMLAGTVNTASNLITKSQASLEAYYENTNTLADHTAGKISSFSVSVSGTAIQTWDSSTGKVTGYEITGGPILGSKKMASYS